MKSERLAFRVTEKEKAQIKKQADKDNRSLSDYVRLIVIDKIKEEVEMETRIKYFTKAKATGEVGYAVIPKGHVKNIESDQNFEIWAEEIPYRVMYITDTLEEVLHEYTDAQEAVDEAEWEWSKQDRYARNRVKIEVREIIDDYENEKGEVIYNYNLIWESK